MKRQRNITPSIKSRRATLNKIRMAITEQYHQLSAVVSDDRITTRRPTAGDIVVLPEGVKPESIIIMPPELDQAFEHLSDAINCLNRELGRKENSRADGDGSS